MKRKSRILKGGGITRDRRLDRIAQYDPRSRQFSIAALQVEGKPLRSYTWRCNEHFDQGPDGACVAFATAHELAARPSEVKGLTNRRILEEIYWEAQKIDPWEGGAYPGADPQYEGTSVLAGAQIARKLGWIEEYRWAFTLYDALYGLGHNGPAVLGLNWYEGMSNPNAQGFIRPTGRYQGGHAVLARAINVKEQYITIRNSWGQSWGDGGDCYVTFEDFKAMLSNWGECCFFMRRTIHPDD